jgi:hypothetical protein
MEPSSCQSLLTSASVYVNFFSSRPELECQIEDVVYPAPISANYADAEDYKPMIMPLSAPIAYPRPL